MKPLNQIPMHNITYTISNRSNPLSMPYTIFSKHIQTINDYVVIDTETTGLNGKCDQIVELSAIKFRNNEPVEIFETLIRPSCSIPYVTTRVHGITDDMVKDKPRIEEVLDDFEAFIEDLPIVGYNLLFDLTFIHYAGSTILHNRKLYCTYRLASTRIAKPYPVANHKLQTLCQYFHISIENHHRAYADAYMTGQLFQKLKEL